jgi:DNA-binding ferritin-like protein
LLAAGVQVFLSGLRRTRVLADEQRDLDSADLLTKAIGAWEKNGWMLAANLDS